MFIFIWERQINCNYFSLIKKHLGIISSSSTLLKLLIVFSITLFGKPAFKNFALILAISDWKFQEIFLALCNSLLIAFFFYRNGTFEDQWTGYIYFLTKTWVLIRLFSLIIWVSKNLLWFCSSVNFILGRYGFNASKRVSALLSFLSSIRVVHITLVKYRFQRFYYVLFHFAHVNIWEKHRYGTFHWTSINLFDQAVVDWIGWFFCQFYQ